jgi:pimeloyl-ACP methyl ester carboxylesterase
MNKQYRISVFLICIVSSFLYTSCLRRYSFTDYMARNRKNGTIITPKFGTYEVNGIPMHYASVGHDSLPLLLLIHGAPGSWYGYMKQLEDSVLNSKFHIVSVDRAGYGKSGFGRAITSIKMQAELIEPLLAKYAKKCKAIVVGRSFGAPVAAKLVADNNDKVKSLILIGADMDPEKEKFWWFSRLGRTKLIKFFLPKEFNVATDEKYSRVEELENLKPDLSKIKVPVSVLFGKEDWIVDTSNAHFIKKYLNNTFLRLKMLDNTGHLVSVEKPEVVREEIIYYIGDNSSN